LVESEDSEDAHYHFPFAVTGEQTENTWKKRTCTS
jgi:hypothetical protein